MAYQNPVPLSKELIQGTSNYRVIWEFTSDTPATEPTFRREMTITPGMTIQQGREWLYAQINSAKPQKSVADLIIVGTPVAPLAPVAPTPDPDAAWLASVVSLRKLVALKALGVVSTALDNDISTTLTAVGGNNYTTAKAAKL